MENKTIYKSFQSILNTGGCFCSYYHPFQSTYSDTHRYNGMYVHFYCFSMQLRILMSHSLVLARSRNMFPSLISNYCSNGKYNTAQNDSICSLIYVVLPHLFIEIKDRLCIIWPYSVDRRPVSWKSLKSA